MTRQIADRVRRYREALGLTQREAAAAAGVSQSTWQRIENDEKEPTLGQLGGIAQALGRTVESFTDANPVRDRLVAAPRFKREALTDAERREVDEVKDYLAYLMEVDAHLRYVGVGQHG